MTDKSRNQVSAEQIHLHSVKIVKGNLVTNSDAFAEGQQLSYNASYGLEIGTSIDQMAIRMLFAVNITIIDEHNQEAGNSQYTIEYLFTVENLAQYVTRQGKLNVVDNHLAATLLAIVYSTTRGIILSRTQGTPLEGLLLPVANPVALLQSLTPTANDVNVDVRNEA